MGRKKNKKKPFKGGARNTPSNTAGDRCPPSNIWESRNTPSNTAGDRSPPSNTAGDRCPPSNTAGDRRLPSNAWESRNTPSKTAGDRSPPSITGGDRSPPSITGGVSSPPSNTGGDRSPPSNPGESRSTTSNTGGDEKNERYQEICLPTEHSTAGSTRATRSKQDPIHRHVLKSNVRRLIDNLELSGILQHLRKKEIFPDHVLENIKFQQSPPDQIRKLLEVISESSRSKYAHFLECLSRTKQSHIRKELEDLEEKFLLDKEAMKDVKDIGHRESKCDETKRWDERRQPKDQQFVAKVERSEHPIRRHKHISHESGMVHTKDATLHETEETEDTLVISNTRGTTRKEPVTHNTKERPEEDTAKKPLYSEVAKNKLPTANPSHSSLTTVNMNQSSKKAKKVGANFERKKEFCQFSEKVNDFKDGHFILIISKATRETLHVQLAKIPWTAIFNFDPSSRSAGILSVIEKPISQYRSLHIHSWQDKCNVTEESTHWIDVFGSDERPDSKTERTCKKWWSVVQTGVDGHIHSLARFADMQASYKVILIWPDEQDIGPHIHKLVTKLDEKTSIDLIILDQGGERSHISESAFTMLCTESSSVVKMTLEDMCNVIKGNVPGREGQHSPRRFDLPSHNIDAEGIPDAHAAWLKEDIEVLYKTNPYEELASSVTQDTLQSECDNFNRGGILPWYMWYEIGPGHVDVKRDIMDGIISDIRKHVDTHKAACVRLCHAPGSGGTTLGQRILWELHTHTPCAQVKLRTGSSIPDIAKRVEFLYEKTKLPIVVMMDGEDEQRVEFLVKALERICAVILYIKRYPYPIGKTSNGSPYMLKGEVSKKEANLFALKFQNHCYDEKKRKAIQTLSDRVRDGSNHYVFEYGLTAYTFEYKGIESYVHGFLQLEKNNTEHGLQSWQSVLGILSLVYYYGQLAMPCQFFASILNRDPKKIVSISSFPDVMRELIVPESNDAGKFDIRISHYYIAKEILEQMLPWPIKRTSIRSDRLCIEARKKLEQFAITFITLAGTQTKGNTPYRTISTIMTRIFITRDNKPVGEGENLVKQKANLSPILEDLESKAPYKERFNVLEQLANSFPTEAQYFAHLGRLYTICRPEEESKAEQCFKNALEVCTQEIGNKELFEYPYNLKLTLMYIYHMTGMMHMKRVAMFTGKSLGDKPQMKTKFEEAVERSKELLPVVREACKYFDLCRQVTPSGHEKNYGYISEINVRLQLCDFLVQNCTKGGGIFQFTNDPSSDRDLTNFVDECFSQIDFLILDCYTVIEPAKMDASVGACAKWYSALFNVKAPGHTIITRDNSIQSKRMEIAARKLQYAKDDFGFLEHVYQPEDISFIVSSLEHIFAAVHDEGEQFNKRYLDLDYREWLFGIRHPKFKENYSIEHVHTHVLKWSEEIRTPYSKFYLFIMKSLLGFGSSGQSGSSELLNEAQQLKEELLKQAAYAPKPRYPREWLGDCNGIKRLVPSLRFFGQIEGREINRVSAGPLAIMKGTICPPNDKPAAGYIDLNLGKTNYIRVRVFFVPVRCHPEMKGEVFANTEVEFLLRFSLSHGYEAFNVMELKSMDCECCTMPVKYTSRDRDITCVCKHKTKISRQKNGDDGQSSFNEAKA